MTSILINIMTFICVLLTDLHIKEIRSDELFSADIFCPAFAFFRRATKCMYKAIRG